MLENVLSAKSVNLSKNDEALPNNGRCGRIPVSTKSTGCLPFNVSQKAQKGFMVGENPVKLNGKYVMTYQEALEMLRAMDCAGWRDYGLGNSQSAHKAIGWVTAEDAARLLNEKNKNKRVELFESMTDIVS